MATTTGSGGQGRSRSRGLLAKDIIEGYVALTPLVLRKFDAATYKELHHHLRKLQATLRSEGVSIDDHVGLRSRNLRLQRMHQAITVLEHQARLNKIVLT
jgi:long-subunit acyl-CoA synthetase (AMP-forming)